LKQKKLRKYLSSQWFFDARNWQKLYNCSSIVVIILLKKIQLLSWFFNPGKLPKSRNLEIFFDVTNE